MFLRKKTKQLYNDWLYKLVNGSDDSCIILSKRELKKFWNHLRNEMDKGNIPY